MHIRKQNEAEPCGSAQSAGAFNGGIVLLRFRPLQYTLLLLLTLFILAAVAVLSTRSIWHDEAKLLRSVYEIGVLDFFHPLPYYDQASPFLASVVIKLISGITETNFVLFRWLIFLFIALCAAPFLIKIKRTYGLNGVLVFMLICAANIYNVLLYTTEIKHYGFEIAGVFIFMYWFLIYLENPDNGLLLRWIWLPLVAMAMGFSTLLLFPAFFLFVIINSLIQYNSAQGNFLKNVVSQHALIFVLMAISASISYVFMLYITIFQIENHEIYEGMGLEGDIRQLRRLIQSAFSHNLFIIFAISLLSFLENRQTLLFKFNIFFISALVVVVVLKATGMYPVVYSRHIMWVVPISMVFLTIYINTMLRKNYLLGLFLMLFLSTTVYEEFVSLRRGHNGELMNNNALSMELGQMLPSDVFVVGHARPFLDIYQLKNPALLKHRYFGLMPDGDLSAIKNPPDAAFAAGPLRYEEFAEWQFNQLPQTRQFLLVISHLGPIDQEPADERIRTLRSTLSKNACEYESEFAARGVQILKVSCAQPGESG